MDSGPSVVQGLWCRLHSTWFGLLVVLVRPHIVGEGTGQAVEGEAFEAVAEHRRAHHGERYFEREHDFDYGAEFRALRWVEPCEMLVGGEHAIGQAVVAVEFGQLMQEGLPVFILTAHDSPHWRGFERLALLTPCVASAVSLSPLCSSSLMNSRVMRCVYLKSANSACQSYPC